MGCEMYGQSTWWSFGFWREPEKERQKKALAELSPEHRELLMALVDLAWYCYNRLAFLCPMWRGGAIKEFAPELVARVIEAGRSVGLSEQECSYWYNWIAFGADKAMPDMSTYWVPIHEIEPLKGIGDGVHQTFEQDYMCRIPPHDGEVISLLMVRAGLEWLEHLKSQGKL